MPGSVILTNTFANLSGNQQASTLDTNFSEVVSPLNAFGTFNTYLVDSGAANALSVTVAPPQTVSYSAGLFLQVKVANTNTGAATINVNSLGATPIVNPNGNAVVAGQLLSGMIALLQYNGTNFILLNSSYIPSAQTNIVKSSSTARASTNTRTIDPDLQIALGAGSYVINLILNFYSTSASNGGIYLQLKTTNSSASPYPLTCFSNVNGSGIVAQVGGNAAATFIFSTLTNSVSPAFLVDSLFMSGSLVLASPDTLGLYWAQDTVSTGNATINAGSVLSVTAATNS